MRRRRRLWMVLDLICGFVAARQGFEPRYAAPEAAVLPLNERATRLLRGWTRELIDFYASRAPRRKCQLVHHKVDSRTGSNPRWGYSLPLLLLAQHLQRTQTKDAIAGDPSRCCGEDGRADQGDDCRS